MSLACRWILHAICGTAVITLPWLARAQNPYLVRNVSIRGVAADPTSLVDVGGTLFFIVYDPRRERELWKSDGTAGGTTRVVDASQLGLRAFRPEALWNVDGILYLQVEVRRGSESRAELWKSDGTPAGTVRVETGEIPAPFTR